MPRLSLDIGLGLLRKKAFKALHTEALQAIRADIKDPIPYFLLGTIAFEHDNFAKALELFVRARRLDPDEVYYPAYEAMTLSVLRRSNEARLTANAVADRVGNNAHLHDMLGVIYSRCGFHEEAITHFEAAAERDSGEPNYFFNLAASQQFLGRFDDAKAAYETALGLDPAHQRAWSSFISLEKQSEDANHLRTLKALFGKSGNSSTETLHFGHAIAKTLEDLGRHAESLDWLLKAKADMKAEFPFDRANAAELFKAAKAGGQLDFGRRELDQRTVPLFVVGLPRTGTTLVDRILSSHSQVRSAGELSAFAELVKMRSGTKSPYVLDVDTLRAAEGIDLEGVAKDYLTQTEALAAGVPNMVDKMPLNFFYAALMVAAFPKVKIIALRRGAMDSCLSNFRQLFSTQFSYYNYTFDLDDTAYFYRLFDDLMTHWRETLPAENFMEVHYENIVHDQVHQTERLLDFCDLEWEDACLRFHENEAAVSTASSVQVRQPLYTGSIGRWKKYGNKLDGLQSALEGLS